MISTLIRTSKVSTPPPIGTSDYLVNTENNKIIYPYTLAENILGRDTNGDIIIPDENSKPIFGGAGIDPSGYKSARFSLAGVRIPAASSDTTVSRYRPEVDDGVYILGLELFYNLTPAPGSNNRYKFLQVASTTDGGLLRQYVVESYSGYLNWAGSMVARLRKTDTIDVYVSNSIDGSTRSFGSGAYIIYRMIRLCDLPE